jgi:diaminopimelate epimerase
VSGMTRFLKVEGAGNDFCLVDARRTPAHIPPRKTIRALLDRHRGIGGDGLLWLLTGPDGHARVRYWNADGGAAAFCGNGARCVALLLLRERRAEEVVFDFGRRRLHACRAEGDRVAVLVPLPRVLPPPRPAPPRKAGSLRARKARQAIGAGPLWIDSGVPHWIIPVPSVAEIDLPAAAPALRSWRGFGPGGTNVDWVEQCRSALIVRTWERGVEGETLACGSGLVAAGFWALSSLGLRAPLSLRSRGGDLFRLASDAGGRGLWLEGPARVVFEGRTAL